MKLSASRIHLAMLCQYPFAPGVETPESTVGEAARLGTAWHAVAAHIINHGTHPHSNSLIEGQCKAAGLDPKMWAPVVKAMGPIEAAETLVRKHLTARAEVAYAYNPATGAVRELGQDLGRGYAVNDGEIPGTADVIWTEADPVTGELTVVIRDWKTGSQYNLQTAQHNMQLAFLALCAARILDPDRIRVELAFVSEDGDVSINAHTYEPIDLIDVEERVQKMWAARVGARPQPGAHCTSLYCPLRVTCPATQAALVETVPTAPTESAFPLVVAGPDAIQSPAHAAWVLHRVRAVEAALEAIRSALKGYVDVHGSIAIGDGKIWGPLQTTREEVMHTSSDKLIAELAKHVPTEAAAELVTATIEKAAIERLAKTHAKPRKGAALARSIMSSLRQAGMVRESVSTQYREAKQVEAA